MPRPLLGLAPAPGESFKDGVERMMGTPIELLAEEIARCGTLLGNGAWDDAARDPGLWLRRYVASLLRAWKGFRPVWRQARAALDREVERIGTVTALDAQLELLDGLLPTGVVQGAREVLRAVPSAATHHVDALEAAGLVERYRRGRNVLVDRTARGEAPLELYDEPLLRQAGYRTQPASHATPPRRPRVLQPSHATDRRHLRKHQALELAQKMARPRRYGPIAVAGDVDRMLLDR
jgi:DNA-binding MarR family transcriptional regulator